MSDLVEVTPEQVRKIVRGLGQSNSFAGYVEWCYSLVQGGIKIEEAIRAVNKEQEDERDQS